MPTYDYRCKCCDHGFEAFNCVANYDNQRCVRCGAETDIEICLPGIHTFKPYFDTQLGVEVKSPRDKKQVAEALGVTNVGDAKDHEIDHAASYNRKKQGEAYLDRLRPAFYKSYRENVENG